MCVSPPCTRESSAHRQPDVRSAPEAAEKATDRHRNIKTALQLVNPRHAFAAACDAAFGAPDHAKRRVQIDVVTAVRAFGQRPFNLLRTGADGSLVLSMDRWHVSLVEGRRLVFEAESPEAERRELLLEEVVQVTWDRLPRQRSRSQIRFHLRNGDRWTFSGEVDLAALPGPGDGAEPEGPGRIPPA